MIFLIQELDVFLVSNQTIYVLDNLRRLSNLTKI